MILFDLICSNVHVANFENFSQNRSLINFSLILTVHYTRYNIVLMDSIQSKTHVVQGYEYREYRGPGLPSSLSGMTLKPTIGDLYIYIARINQIWVYAGRTKGWVEWRSMKTTHLVPHPEKELILFPNTSRFAWVPAKGISGYRRQAQLTLGDLEDTAHNYISIILETEGVSVPNVAVEKRAETTSSKENNSKGGYSEINNDEGESEKGETEEDSDMCGIEEDDESRDPEESMVDDIMINEYLNDISTISGHNHAIPGEEDISMENEFDTRCSDMRSANAEIRQAVSKSSGNIRS
jgi:hypothetical protein